MNRSSPTRCVRYHVLVYVILAFAAVGCGAGDDVEPGDRTTPLRKSELLKPGESGTLDARACELLSAAVVARAVGARGIRLAARPNNSLDLTICEWHGGPVRSVKLLVDSAPRAQGAPDQGRRRGLRLRRRGRMVDAGHAAARGVRQGPHREGAGQRARLWRPRGARGRRPPGDARGTRAAALLARLPRGPHHDLVHAHVGGAR